MFRFKFLMITLLLLSSLSAGSADAKDYIIYSITQDFPMGEPGEILKKNFYVNMGSRQGLKSGTVLDVHRLVMRNDPYTSKKTYSHKVKIGELKIIHTEQNNAIATVSKNSATDLNGPHFEIRKLMIGDKVNVKIKN